MSETSAGPSGVLGRSTIGSSTVAIGTATAFIVIAAGLSFVADDGQTRAPAAWTLRGSIASEPALRAAPAGKDRRVKGQQMARSDLD